MCIDVYIYITQIVYMIIYVYKYVFIICIYYISMHKSFVTTKFLFWEHSWEKNDGCGKVDELRRNVSGLDGRSKLAHTVFLVYGGQQMLASGNLT